MSNPEKTTKASIFIDFVPAELRENKDWMIVYYCKIPFTEELQIKRSRVKPLKSISERRKLIKRMISTIKKKLYRGWNPWINNKNSKSFTKLKDAMSEYISNTEKEVKRKQKSDETLRSYKSYVRNINLYLKLIDRSDIFLLNFDSDLANDFIDYVYYDRDNSARTRNNYLDFLKNLCKYLLKRNYIKEDSRNGSII